MAKKREADKELHYKNIINKQKSIIKNLKRKADRGNKVQERYNDLELELLVQLEEENKEVYKTTDTSKCPKCGKGTLELIDLKVRKMLICDKCNYREIRK